MSRKDSLTRRTFLGWSAAATVSAFGASARADTPKKKLVMLAGHPSHGPGEHEFNAGTLLFRKCLASVPGLETTFYRNGWP
ncbi:MAG TPA: hypothetical protein VFA18_18260, partial [Gemmataceae bacterium]|nr:hypothetical protein [Gemmataceae bacterium]